MFKLKTKDHQFNACLIPPCDVSSINIYVLTLVGKLNSKLELQSIGSSPDLAYM